jgi:hypothetical protein
MPVATLLLCSPWPTGAVTVRSCWSYVASLCGIHSQVLLSGWSALAANLCREEPLQKWIRPQRDLNPVTAVKGRCQAGSRCNYEAAVALQCPVRND